MADSTDLDSTVSINDYYILGCDRPARGGGVAFYCKNSLKVKPVVLPPTNHSGLEQLWISTKISGKKLCLGTLYRPPTCNLVDCLSDLETVLTTLIPEYDFIAMGGDFNVDFLNDRDPACLLLSDLINKYGLYQLINEPIRVTNT